MRSYRTVYRFIKQILFFSYFLSLNIYSSPIFILCQCCQQICNLVTYFLGVCIGGGIVGMDIWSRIFVEELRTIFKVCVCLDKRRGGQPNVHRCGQGGGLGREKGGQKSLEMFRHPLWTTPEFWFIFHQAKNNNFTRSKTGTKKAYNAKLFKNFC